MTRVSVVLPFLALLLPSMIPAASAQEPASAASIAGRVSDPSGAVIRAAAVTIRSADGSEERRVATGSSGTFELSNLPPGRYTVTVTASGFTGDIREITIPAPPLDVVLQVAGNVEDVIVRGVLDDTTAGGKLPITLRETVQTVQIVPRSVIEDRGVTTINEAVETAINVQPIAGYGGMDSASVISRGFANDWVLRNGFRLFRFGVPVDPVVLDRLEILKGPASLLAGQTDPGGTLNMVSKSPVRTPFVDFDSTAGSHGFYRQTLDAGGAIPGTDERLFTRVTLAHEAADSHRDSIDQDKLFVAPQFRWEPGPATAAQVELNYFRNNFDFERGLPPSPLTFDVPISRTVKDPRFPQSRSRNWALFQSITHRLNANWTVRQALGAMFNDNRIFETYLGSPDELGDLSVFLDRSVEENNSLTVQGDIQGTWSLGGRLQRTIVGLEYSDYVFRYDFLDADGTFSPVARANLFNPLYTYPFPALETPVFGAEYGSKSISAYVDHQAEVSRRVKIMAGGRLDRARGFNTDRISGEDAYPEKTDVRFSPRLGVVYTPVSELDVFGSYATSFKPNVFGTDAEGRAFDAEIGAQFEGGIRREFFGGLLRAQAAIFHIEKDNVVVYEPPDFRAGRSGARRSRGFELEAVGSPVSGWTMTGGYGFVDATITEDTDPGNVGERLFGVPRHQLNLWNRYEVQQGRGAGLAVGYGVFYAGERPADEPASAMLPAYTRHDAMVQYRRGRIAGQLNIENLTDARVYDTHGFFIYPRDGVAVRAAINVGF